MFTCLHSVKGNTLRWSRVEISWVLPWQIKHCRKHDEPNHTPSYSEVFLYIELGSCLLQEMKTVQLFVCFLQCGNTSNSNIQSLNKNNLLITPGEVQGDSLASCGWNWGDLKSSCLPSCFIVDVVRVHVTHEVPLFKNVQKQYHWMRLL